MKSAHRKEKWAAWGALAAVPVLLSACSSTSTHSTGAGTPGGASQAGAASSSASVSGADSSASATSGSSSAGQSGAVDMGYVTAQVEQYKQLPKFVAPGPAFDAASAMKGKTIYTIPYSNSIPFDQGLLAGEDNAAKMVGFQHQTWTNQGQPSQWNQGIQNAVTKSASLIDVLTIDPNVLAPALQQAKSKGVKVVDSHVYALGQDAPSWLDGVVRFDYAKAGRLLADWTIYKSGGHVNALIMGADDSVSTKPYVAAIEDEFKARCGSSCTVAYVSVPTPDWTTKIQPVAQAKATANQNLNYIIPVYDSMSPYVVAALAATHTADRIKIATFNGSTNVIDLVREGKVEMDIGEDLNWAGEAIIDGEMRLVAGVPVPENAQIPMRIFDSSNASDAGTPAKVSQGYGNADQAGWKQVWKLG